MLYTVARFLGVDKLVAGALVYGLIALIGVGSIWGYGALRYQAGKSYGISIERIAWEEARRKLLIQLEAERKARQSVIDRIEAEYLDRRDDDLAKIQSLENTINELERENAQNPGACQCGLPKRLRDSLAPIGR